MALIIRIDVDRPYGKQPILRHMLSRLSSDFYFPKIETLGYLKELRIILQILNERNVRAYIFFRRCTLGHDHHFGQKNLDYASQAPLHPGYACCTSSLSRGSELKMISFLRR